jgi:hypothetical protein
MGRVIPRVEEIMSSRFDRVVLVTWPFVRAMARISMRIPATPYEVFRLHDSFSLPGPRPSRWASSSRGEVT